MDTIIRSTRFFAIFHRLKTHVSRDFHRMKSSNTKSINIYTFQKMSKMPFAPEILKHVFSRFSTLQSQFFEPPRFL